MLCLVRVYDATRRVYTIWFRAIAGREKSKPDKARSPSLDWYVSFMHYHLQRNYFWFGGIAGRLILTGPDSPRGLRCDQHLASKQAHVSIESRTFDVYI